MGRVTRARAHYWALLGFAGVAMAGCAALRKQPYSEAIPQATPPTATVRDGGDDDAGSIAVHATVARAIPFGSKRIDLTALTDVQKIFELLRTSRQADRVGSEFSATNVGAQVSGLLPDSRTTTRTDGSNSSNDLTTIVKRGESLVSPTPSASPGQLTSNRSRETTGVEKSGETSTQTVTDVAKAATAAEAPEVALKFPTTPLGAVSASPYELLYATAETVLAARSIESLYNIEDAPDGYTLFKIPVVVSFKPGRVTRKNYTAEAQLTFSEDINGAAFRLWAVAPGGLSSFAASADSELRQLQAALGVGVPLGTLGAKVDIGRTKQLLNTLASISRRPDVQVAIKDTRTMVVRYQGRETLNREIELSPESFNLEVLALIYTGGDDNGVAGAKLNAVMDTKVLLSWPAADASQTDNPKWRVNALTTPGVSAGVEYTRYLKMKVESTYKPSLRRKNLPTSREANAVQVGEKGDRYLQVYVPPQTSTVEKVVFFPDGRLVVTGKFQSKTCTCLAVFYPGDNRAKTPVPACQLKDPMRELTYRLFETDAPSESQKKAMVARLSLVGTGGNACSDFGPEALLERLTPGATPTPAPIPTPLPTERVASTLFIPITTAVTPGEDQKAAKASVAKGQYFADHQAFLEGLFPAKSCACIAAFDDHGVSLLPGPYCSWTEKTSGVIPFRIVKPSLFPNNKKIQARVTFVANEDSNSCTQNSHLSRVLSVHAVSLVPAVNVLPAAVPKTASIDSVEAKLDARGVVVLIRYKGTAETPVVLIDGANYTPRRIELFKETKDGVETVTGGSIWVELRSAVGDKVQSRALLVSLGPTNDTTETRKVIALRQ